MSHWQACRSTCPGLGGCKSDLTIQLLPPFLWGLRVGKSCVGATFLLRSPEAPLPVSASAYQHRGGETRTKSDLQGYSKGSSLVCARASSGLQNVKGVNVPTTRS